jgi:hypothetical protein
LTSFGAIAAALVAVAILEVVLPGRDLYHAGWFNVALAAGTIVMAFASRKRFANPTGRLGVAAVLLGGAIAGIATIANGLFAPDNRTVVGAPGQHIRVEDAGGVLQFPLVGNGVPSAGVSFDGPALRTFVTRTIDRTVVAVDARDPHGAHLTVTQPSGSAFLSPVLLMQQRQAIAGMNLPFDSFAVPAARRVVKAVLFTPQQAAMLRNMEGLEVPAVLFAVDDENDRPLRNGIALCVDGQSIVVGGLLLHPTVLQYPAVELIAVPPPALVVLSALLVAGGFILGRKAPWSSAS